MMDCWLTVPAGLMGISWRESKASVHDIKRFYLGKVDSFIYSTPGNADVTLVVQAFSVVGLFSVLRGVEDVSSLRIKK